MLSSKNYSLFYVFSAILNMCFRHWLHFGWSMLPIQHRTNRTECRQPLPYLGIFAESSDAKVARFAKNNQNHLLEMPMPVQPVFAQILSPQQQSACAKILKYKYIITQIHKYSHHKSNQPVQKLLKYKTTQKQNYTNTNI